MDRKLLAKAQRLGLIRPLGEGRFEVPSPTLYRAGEELLALGVEPRVVLAVAEQVVRRAEAISKDFVELFLEAIWKPFVEAGRPEEEWPQRARGARAAAPARLRGGAGDVPARDDAGRRASVRAGARAAIGSVDSAPSAEERRGRWRR